MTGDASNARFPTLLRAGAWLLAFLLPLAVFPSSFHAPFVHSKTAVLLLLGIPLWLLGNERRTDGVLLPWRLLTLLGLGFGAAVSLARGLPLGEWPTALLLPLAPLLLLEIGVVAGRRASLDSLFDHLPWIGIPVLVVGAARRLWGWPASLPDRPDVAIAATIGNSNALAEFVAPLVLVAAASMIGQGRETGRRLQGAFLTLLLGAFLLWTDSRGGWLAAATGTAVLLGARLLELRGAERARWGLAAGAGLLVVSVALLATPSFRERAATIADPQHATNRVRVLVWDAGWELVRSRPLLGTGLGGFEGAFLPHRRAEEWALSGADSRVDTPHQDPLWVLAELGLVGVFVVAAGLFLFVGLLRRLGQDEAGRRHAGTLAAVLACVGVTALVRSPLSHPCGVLVPTWLTGAALASLSARPGRERLGLGVRLLVGALFVLALVFASREWRSDRRLREALASFGSIQTAGKAQDPVALRRHFEDATRGLRTLADDPWTSSPRAFRAALAARELARTRIGIAAAGLKSEAELLPGPDLALKLCESSLVARPAHAGARGLMALVHRDHGHAAAAALCLEDGLQLTPAAPRLRLLLADLLVRGGQPSRARQLILEELEHPGPARSGQELLLGKLGLQLGTDPEELGFYLDAPTGPAGFDAGSLTNADPIEARDRLLIHLGRHPRDSEALGLLADRLFESFRDDEEMLALANRATARMRLLWALGDLERGELRLAKIKLRIAGRKDPELLDVQLLNARVAALENDAPRAQKAVDALRASGVTAEQLEPRLRAQDALAALLNSGALKLSP